MGTTIQTAPRQPGVNVAQPFVGLPGAAWILLLLIICYAPILYRLAYQWSTDEDMGHGFFVPAIAAYMAWQRRGDLESASLKSNPLGLVLLLWAAAQSIIGNLGAEIFLSRTAFLLSVYGSVLYLGGWTAIRIFFFPLFLLLFMVPLPAIIYNQITFPLQLLASRVAEFVLSAVGIPVIRDGNVLELPSQKLSVVEACSGIRSLLSLSFLSLVYGQFFDDKPWMKWVLLPLTIPIAITANAARVTTTGMLSEMNPEFAHGFYHTVQGWVVFMVAMIILVAVHRAINILYSRSRKRPPVLQPAVTE